MTRSDLSLLARRAQAVVENTARHLIVPAANLVISYLVISRASEDLWGQFVVNLVLVTLSTHVVSWGNKEYLLRAFSDEPAQLPALWQRSLLTRGSGLVLLLILLPVLGYRGEFFALVGLWLVLAVLYQSLDVVVLYLHRFRLNIAAEISALITTVGILTANAGRLDEGTVVFAYVLGLLVKTVILLAGLSPQLFAQWRPGFDRRHLLAAAPFFLIGLSGMLQSKMDLYAVALFLERGEIGRYQVTINLFITFQAMAAFILMPFVKNLYQSGDDVSHDVSRRLGIAGVVMAALSVPLGFLVLDRLYGFVLPWPVYLAGAMTIPPIFHYLPLIYLLFKHGDEKHVVLVNFVGAACNLVLVLVLLPLLGFLGALISAAASQWMMMIWYGKTVRRSVKYAD